MSRLRIGLAWMRASWWLRINGISCGRRPKFFGRRPLIAARGRIVVGDAFQVVSRQFRVQLGAGADGELRIGSDVYVNQGVNIFAARLVEIGDHVHFAD